MSLIKTIKTARNPEAYWRKEGWGPKLTFLVERPVGDPLALTLRVPVDWTTYDVVKLREDGAAARDSLAQALATLGRVVEASGVITVLGMAHAVEREGQPDTHLFATMTAALSDDPGPAADSIPGAEVVPISFEDPRGNYAGVRIRRVENRNLVPDQPPMAFVTAQYLLHTDHGWLAITFVTPQHEVFGRLAPLFDTIASGCRLEPAGSKH